MRPIRGAPFAFYSRAAVVPAELSFPRTRAGGKARALRDDGVCLTTVRLAKQD